MKKLNNKVAVSPSRLLVEVHCYACDYHGYGDPDDACYFCGEYDLQEFDAEEEAAERLFAWL